MPDRQHLAVTPVKWRPPSHVMRAGLRVLGAGRAADRLRDAERRGPSRDLAAPPGALLLRPRPLAARGSRPGPGPHSGGAAGPGRAAGAGRDRRHLFRRRGKKVWAVSWFHDASGAGQDKTGYGNNWVI